MIQLDYRLNPDESLDIDLARATEAELDYYLFPGDILFRIGAAAFDAPWGWVPVLDFANRVQLLLAGLADGATATFEFTESEDTLVFGRSGDRVQVSASYTPARAEASLGELQAAAAAFLRRVAAELAGQFPRLPENAYFRSIRDRVAAP